ncbi:ATP-dependent RNA helicase DBP7 [Pseudozyma hubeiensis SY62]|uniref:ATP-dependent RNA helicase DBP7 n=1 Tax=Pseudozyma hubeiensis (strain SY62) TaxID=1305764 RepID=R9PJ95_PSEHS|nr:ATP-dependent RNA helicase DBP7 [Pseudozyma hubeiensis SY62]GAC98190.1 ATP-dependent RNA helicase DBP7 [Pseudozyma hubeiensis SY62]
MLRCGCARCGCRAFVRILLAERCFYGDEKLSRALLILEFRVGVVADLGERAVQAVEASGGGTCRSIHIEGGHFESASDAVTCGDGIDGADGDRLEGVRRRKKGPLWWSRLCSTSTGCVDPYRLQGQ